MGRRGEIHSSRLNVGRNISCWIHLWELTALNPTDGKSAVVILAGNPSEDCFDVGEFLSLSAKTCAAGPTNAAHLEQIGENSKLKLLGATVPAGSAYLIEAFQKMWTGPESGRKAGMRRDPPDHVSVVVVFFPILCLSRALVLFISLPFLAPSDYVLCTVPQYCGRDRCFHKFQKQTPASAAAESFSLSCRTARY